MGKFIYLGTEAMESGFDSWTKQYAARWRRRLGSEGEAEDDARKQRARWR
jgi:hypothetical protein